MNGGSARLDLVEGSLLAMGKKCVRRGDKIQGQCPAHDDRNPSFWAAISNRDGDSLVFGCSSGCSGSDIMAALGLRWDQIKADDYRSERSRFHRRESVDSLVIEIARADRASGKRLSEKDRERELQAFKRMRAKGQAIPKGAPTVVEVLREASGADRQA